MSQNRNSLNGFLKNQEVQEQLQFTHIKDFPFLYFLNYDKKFKRLQCSHLKINDCIDEKLHTLMFVGATLMRVEAPEGDESVWSD